jgi:hypothetical protein
MMPGGRHPGLRAVPGGQDPDQVPRLLRFREQHPDVTIDFLPPAWQAVIHQPNGETVIARYQLRQLLDRLDELTTPRQDPQP